MSATPHLPHLVHQSDVVTHTGDRIGAHVPRGWGLASGTDVALRRAEILDVSTRHVRFTQCPFHPGTPTPETSVHSQGVWAGVRSHGSDVVPSGVPETGGWCR